MALRAFNTKSDGINLVLFEPSSDWTPRLTFPSLNGVKRVAIDSETKDPFLKEKGPGSIRRDGYPVGLSVATDSGFKAYYPIKHELGGNLDPIPVLNFFTDLLKRTDIEVVGANVSYDLEWLEYLGIKCYSPIRDVQIAEALIDGESEYGYSLDSLCLKYLGQRKNEELLKLAAEAYYGGKCNPKEILWRLHSKYVGPYGETDPAQTLAVYEKQLPILKQENLMGLFNLECDLVKIVLRMRLNGIRVNVPKAEQLSQTLRKREETMLKTLRAEVGFNLDVWSNVDIEKACKKAGYEYPTTLKGNPSFDKTFLKNSNNNFFKQLQSVRNINRLRTIYVEKLILEWSINGRLHAMFHQTKKDEDGTRYGRFSSSCPNLQQIPSRDKEIAPLIRSLALPEEGEDWCKKDYSQQEPRLTTHYACLMKFKGAERVRAAYLADKTTDFYTLVAAAANLERKPAKDLTLGICYGEGKDKIARDLDLSLDEAEIVKNKFDEANPFVRMLYNSCMNRANETGRIRTILGRLCRFDVYEPAGYGHGEVPLRLEIAKQKWQNQRIKRAYTYKALNRLIQGSAADMTKAAMYQLHQATGRVPLLQVHDELDHSIPKGDEKLKDQMVEIMEHCVDTVVPIYVEAEIGEHWK